MFLSALLLPLFLAATTFVSALQQNPLLYPTSNSHNITSTLFTNLEELARIVDISYCVSPPSLGILHPFRCLSHCKEFPKFSLVTTWNTGPLLSDSCGYIALDHGKERVVVAFRGTYSIANTVVDLSTIPQAYVPYPESGSGDGDDGGVDGDEPKCEGCKVHMGFHTAWLISSKIILPDLERHLHLWPYYKLTLVGHSLGGAVAALAGLELLARGYDPTITTFGEPRIGNKALASYIDQRFQLHQPNHAHHAETENDTHPRYRRVTHVNDPIPLLPLTEWGFAAHAGEIYIRKPALPPSAHDLEHCAGDNDPRCIAGQDSATQFGDDSKHDLLASVADEVQDVLHEPWGVPARYRLWELFFAHRDYFWRLGLCVPGGDPLGGGGRYGDGSGEG
ncbi:hypothetical protein LTR91_025815 [Friedmanniomyces endolithicus]|uniref:Fungal lipase-type domain-containing protein n=1 Tax=Friedmanniomyces endolithicus TaxID=329885 RepID=A0AAN6GZJ2_9PEZI|nr:hypothetical protein LTR38_013256 [Friedmanniomyces endolithicus]KAK0787474.1 hypothetical protein LTR59_010340 [Friedmanniomyces endolithicus]KAK0910124.1 hypothetical protein LTR57_016033 [Friedmanniomyces endolithicus]KAK0950247.1 hypothetical protein LTR91_025815 [Friedmanniomyces endolithicus]KAK0982787.1 hypothetical protein LTS01_011239 [Friedmanniomyces endolithicus]